MTIILTSDQENIISQKVASGIYPDQISAISEALRLLDKKDEYVSYINSSIEAAEKSLSEGRFITAEQLQNNINQRRKSFLENNK